jgi:hypothetical protein
MIAYLETAWKQHQCRSRSNWQRPRPSWPSKYFTPHRHHRHGTKDTENETTSLHLNLLGQDLRCNFLAFPEMDDIYTKERFPFLCPLTRQVFPFDQSLDYICNNASEDIPSLAYIFLAQCSVQLSRKAAS